MRIYNEIRLGRIRYCRVIWAIEELGAYAGLVVAVGLLLLSLGLA